MRGKAVILPLLAASLLLAGCSREAKEYNVLTVFSADASRRSDYLTSVGDSALWDELELSGVTVTQGQSRELTIGEEEWLIVSAELSGDDAELYFCEDYSGSWQLDLRRSFGVNSHPLSEWKSQGGILTVMAVASLSDELPEEYREAATSHFAVRLTDYTGEGAITAVYTREDSDGEALFSLLGDGAEHRVLLRLRPMEGQEGPLWRITQFVRQGWLDENAILQKQNTALLQAVRQGDYETTEKLLNSTNVSVTDANGDGLLFLALRESETEIASLLIGKGCSGQNDNIYWHGMQNLLDFERSDIVELVSGLRQQGGDPGCTAESLSHYLVKESNHTALRCYLGAFLPQGNLSALEGDEIAERYGLEPMGKTANLLDAAVLNNSAPVAETLLSDGVQASSLLKEKLRVAPTSFSDAMLAVLGKQNYFGVLSEVLEDYRTFRESYNQQAADEVERFQVSYNKYMDAAVEDDSFAAKAVMDSSLLEDIVRQLEAVQRVDTPKTEAIGDLWDLMYRYADMMDTAGYYYKRTARSTYIVTRRYLVALFENRLEQGEELRGEFMQQLALYDKLLQNTK